MIPHHESTAGLTFWKRMNPSWSSWKPDPATAFAGKSVVFLIILAKKQA